MKRSWSFALSFTATLLLVGCGGGGGGGANSAAAVVPVASAIQVGAGGTSSRTPVFATTATNIQDVGVTYPGYQNVARASGDPAAVSASFVNNATDFTLVTNVDGKQSTVVFDASTIEQSNGITTVAVKEQDGLNYSMLLAGLSLNYARYGAWAQENGDDLLQNNELFAAVYGGLETPVTGMPVAGSFTYNGQTLGAGIDEAGNALAIAGNISLTADFAARAVSGSINNLVVGGTQGITAALNGGIADNGFNGTMNVQNASQASVGGGTFDGRFFGPNAEEMAGKWAFDGVDGSKAIGAFGGSR